MEKRTDPVSHTGYWASMADPIVIMGWRPPDIQREFLEGVVVASETPLYKVGYHSLAWVKRSFHPVEGKLSFIRE